MTLGWPRLALQEEEVRASISLANNRAGEYVPLSCTWNGLSLLALGRASFPTHLGALPRRRCPLRWVQEAGWVPPCSCRLCPRQPGLCFSIW